MGESVTAGWLARLKRLQNSLASPGPNAPFGESTELPEGPVQGPALLLDHQADDAADLGSGDLELSKSEQLSRSWR